MVSGHSQVKTLFNFRSGSELRKRVTTGILGGAFVLILIIFGGVAGTALIAAVISLGMVSEFVDITFTLPDKAEKKLLLLGTTWLIHFINFWIPRSEYVLLLVVFLMLFGYFLFTSIRHQGPVMQSHFQELMYAVFGAIYLIFLPISKKLLANISHLVVLRDMYVDGIIGIANGDNPHVIESRMQGYVA